VSSVVRRVAFRAIVGAAAAVLAATAAAAQTAPPAAPVPVMEFDAAVRQSIERNPTVARAVTSISRAEALLQQSRAATLPVVSASVTNVTLDSARGFAGGTTQPQNQSTFSADATVPVLAAARWAAVTQARDQIDVAKAGVTQVRQQIAVAAAEAYLTVIAARRQVDVSERSLEAARAHLDYAQKRLEGGAGSRLNQVRAAQVVSSEEARLEVVRFALFAAQEALGVLVAADGPVTAGAEPSFEMPSAMDESAWMTARPDLLTQAAVQRAAERVVQDSWRDWLPTVNASFDPAYVTPRGLFQPSRTWRFTITATQAIFEGGQRKAALRLREITLDQSKITMSDLELQARSEVRLAQESVRSRQRAADAARLSATQADEVLQITTTAFQVGATTNLEVIDAQRSARDAETAAALAQDAVQRARLDLLVALGRFPN
jgi:outer membrane protein TolC